MHPTGRGWALLPAALIAMLLAGCTGTGAAPGPGKAAPAAASGRSPTQPDGPATSSAAPAGESALACGNYIDANASAAPLQVVLGVVALPASPRYPALQTSLSGDGSGAPRLFAKTGLVIRPGTTFELIVPAPFTNRLSIGWGLPGMPHHRVVVNSCPDPRRRVAGLRGRVLDRSPGLRADHRQGRRQTADGAHRPRNAVPWPATAARTEPKLAMARPAPNVRAHGPGVPPAHHLAQQPRQRPTTPHRRPCKRCLIRR